MKSKYLSGKWQCVALVVLCFVMYSVVYMTKNMFTYAMASIVENNIMTKTETGAISAAFWLFYAIFQVVGGFAADRISPSFLICLGIGGGAVANIVIYLNHSYAVILVTWVLNAIVQFGLWPATYKILTTRIAPKYRGSAIFWISLSGIVGMALSMTVASVVSFWKDNFLLSAIFLAVLLVGWIAVYHPLLRRADTFEEPMGAEEPLPKVIKPMSVREMLFGSGLWIIVIIGFFRGAVDSGVKMMTPTMLMESYDNLPAAIATRLSVVLAVFAAVGLFLSRYVQKKFSTNEMKSAPLLMAASIPAMLICCFVGDLHYKGVLAGLSVSTVLVGAASFFTNSTIGNRFAAYGKSGTVSGIVNGAFAFANMVASFVFPAMSETLPWSVIVIIWFVMTLATVVLSLCVLRVWTRFIGENTR